MTAQDEINKRNNYMKKNNILKSLSRTATVLDKSGLFSEADSVFEVMKVIAEDYDEYSFEREDDGGELRFDDHLAPDWSGWEHEEGEDYGTGQESEEIDISGKMLNKMMGKEERDVEQSMGDKPSEESADLESSLVEDLYVAYKAGDFKLLRSQMEIMVPRDEWAEVMSKIRNHLSLTVLREMRIWSLYRSGQHIL